MGSAVKKITKPIKKIVKSPLAPIAAGIFGPAALAARWTICWIWIFR